jgi:hypothetical protein
MIARRLTLIDARVDLYARADWSPAWQQYVTTNAIDIIHAYKFCGIIAVTRVEFLGRGRFEFSGDGELAAVVECLDYDAETPIDLCAWSVAEPSRFATLLGSADALGIDQVENPATFFLGQHLQLRRTPLKWLQAGCTGAVILRPETAPRWLGAAPGRIAGEDLAHARQIARLVYPIVLPEKILAPLRGAA